MNQYKRLLSNTFIFAIGTFSSKILVILMLRFYTGMMTQDEMGIGFDRAGGHPVWPGALNR